MGNKINSNALRLGVNKGWKSTWYANKRDYVDTLHEDLAVRKYVREALQAAGLDTVEINRSAAKIEVNAFVAKPGVAIGRSGSGIEELNKKLKNILGTEVDVKINEVKKPETSARIIASEIVSGLERKMPPKLLALNQIERAINGGAKGIRIWVAGRINGAQQARTVKFHEGPVPLHTLKANIDYVTTIAETADLGVFGVKVWVYKPEEKDKDSK